MQARPEQPIRRDFLDWSGGFPPESERDIFVYIEYALPKQFVSDSARDFLRHWMEEESRETRR